jgi:anti-sigma B factor antagonist
MFYASSRPSSARSPSRGDDALFRLTERDIWPGCREIEVEGELDLAVSEALRSALDRAAGEGLDVLVDLTECDFIDASGVTVLVHADERLTTAGRQLLLCGVRGQVRRVLWVTGLDGTKNGAAAPLRQAAVRDQALATSRGVGSVA